MLRTVLLYVVLDAWQSPAARHSVVLDNVNVNTNFYSALVSSESGALR